MKTFITVVATVIATLALLVAIKLYVEAQPSTYTACSRGRTVSLNGEATTGEDAQWSEWTCEERTIQP